MNTIWYLPKKCLKFNNRKIINFPEFVRNFAFKAERLDSRSLIKVSGEDVYSFLQGLITNDVKHLSEGKLCLYTLFLNNKGRVMCDSILYKYADENTLLIECDSRIETNLKCHLKYFRVRKKINIETADQQLWVIYNANDGRNVFSDSTVSDDTRNMENMTLCKGQPLQGDPNYDEYLKQKSVGLPMISYKDPRMYYLGVRIIAEKDFDVTAALEKADVKLKQSGDSNYTTLRYKLGVAEGIAELPVEKCFPPESNCDYLHGVSFHKGCYLGQELTARTHHTGVVRKRIMPLRFTSPVLDCNIPVDSIVHIENSGKNVGKFRAKCGIYGIGLLRVNEVLEESAKLTILDKYSVSTYRPLWWPQQSQNDVIQSSRE